MLQHLITYSLKTSLLGFFISAMGLPGKKMEEPPTLIGIVFSWSLSRLMNHHLYTNKVVKIPDDFGSASHYLNSFVTPLVEETRADLSSAITTLHSSPACEVFGLIKGNKFKPPKRLLYNMTVMKDIDEDGRKKPTKSMVYVPGFGDLIAFTDVARPKCIDDLNRPRRPYTIALVQGVKAVKDEPYATITILSSKPISFENLDKLFVVYLTNLVTNIRIWDALHSEGSGNMRIIHSVLRYNPSMEEDCSFCLGSNAEGTNNLPGRIEDIDYLGLDESQMTAVSNCVALTKCDHRSSVKLIWGPPGTGKTKTIASLVFTLLKMRSRTLICAPTNVAVIGVTKRLMTYLSSEQKGNTYGLGDVVLFGNGERMKIGDHRDLDDVFLQNRIEVLSQCFDPLDGWNASLTEMIRLLEDPEGQYSLYVERLRGNKDSDNNGVSEDEKIERTTKGNVWKKIMIRTIKENKAMMKENADREEAGCKESVVLWSFQEFFMKKFLSLGKLLILCIIGLRTHLPTRCLPIEVLQMMNTALGALQAIKAQLDGVDLVANEGRLKRSLIGNEEMGSVNGTTGLCVIRLACLRLLMSLRESFSIPISDILDPDVIKNFCLANASLVFCTVSSSAKMYTKGPFKLAIIDEAAQLKECESCIPLQLPGLRHAVLVGDEKQLPAMVMSKICVKAGFGRSLFERLVTLGHSKHLLDVQYRMHPSISLFPNEKFYAKQIKNGPKVLEKNYSKRFCSGKFFGPYSFINVINGVEAFDNKHSRRNLVEVSVVVAIVSKLYRESMKSKQRVRVGCISPYKAQVFSIQEALGKTYSSDVNDVFSVNVRSVDGFQGSEEDIIIISTVRCNGNGSIGFLDNHQRTNVALTRARHCLWILGNEATLLNSNSIWHELVSDAKNRDCFYNAGDDEGLSAAIGKALIDLDQMDAVFTTGSVLFQPSTWKVHFSSRFHDSIARIRDRGIRKHVADVVIKISNGWRQHRSSADSSSPLEWCNVNKKLKLVWTISILWEKSRDIQVIKIVDVLGKKEVPQLVKEFNRSVRMYPVDQLKRCLCRRIERGRMVPMEWEREGKDDPRDEVASQLASMSLRDSNF